MKFLGVERGGGSRSWSAPQSCIDRAMQSVFEQSLREEAHLFFLGVDIDIDLSGSYF
jgi:hypothetical protein